MDKSKTNKELLKEREGRLSKDRQTARDKERTKVKEPEVKEPAPERPEFLLEDFTKTWKYKDTKEAGVALTQYKKTITGFMKTMGVTYEVAKQWTDDVQEQNMCAKLKAKPDTGESKNGQ
jgi:hypothetical protein